MSSARSLGKVPEEIDYPTSDGKPMTETDTHQQNMIDLLDVLRHRYADDPQVYVSANLFIYYTQGDRRRHVSPDVFLVRGVPKRRRDNYLLWEEGRSPELVIELTSSSTRDEDIETKFNLYQTTLRVREYFLFDPRAEYLDPPLEGYRLQRGRYVRIRPVKGRVPSKVLGLHLERNGWQLRLYDPTIRQWLPSADERLAHEAAARQQAEAELERLRRENESLRRGAGKKP